MEQLILKTSDYSVWKADKSCLRERSPLGRREKEKTLHRAKTPPKEGDGHLHKYEKEASRATPPLFLPMQRQKG